MDKLMKTLKIMHLKEQFLFVFALLCFMFHFLFQLICAGGYEYIYHIFDKGYIILCLFVIAQTVAFGFTKRASTMILLMLSNLLTIPFYIDTVLTLILLLIKGRKADIILKWSTALSCAFSIFGICCLLITTGTFITHFDFEEYTSPSGEKNIIVLEDRSFDKKLFSHIFVAENQKMQFGCYSFSKEGDLLARVYHTDEDQKKLNIEWIDDGTILVKEREYTIRSAD